MSNGGRSRVSHYRLLVTNLVSLTVTAWALIAWRKSSADANSKKGNGSRDLQECCTCICEWPDLSGCESNVNLGYSSSVSGSIPTEIGRWTHLISLKLDGNMLTGSIPSEIASLTQLTLLWLPFNALTGSIPVELTSMNELIDLQLLGNMLSGSIPTQIGNLDMITHLDLSLNMFSGRIPTEIGLIRFMQFLDLGSNELTGNIPSEIGAIPAVSFGLGFFNNMLTGTIPSELGRIRGLRHFVEFDWNDLTGTIPASLGAWTAIDTIYFQRNRLRGFVPDSLCNADVAVYIDCGEIQCICCSRIDPAWSPESSLEVPFEGGSC